MGNRTAGIFQSASIQRSGEGHVAAFGRDIEQGKKTGQIGIVGGRVDDKPGIDRNIAVRSTDSHCMAMTTQTLPSFIKGHVMCLVE